MHIAIFSAHEYEKPYFENLNYHHTLVFICESLSVNNVDKAKGCQAVCCFVTDCLNSEVIHQLKNNGIQLIALRSAGYDHVDLETARELGISVVRVPKYSPEAIAEFAVGLILTLNRKILQAYTQGLQYNFSLDKLMGFNLYQKTVGIIGTGHIGTAFAKIIKGFGCRILACDPYPNQTCLDLKVQYVEQDELYKESDIISLHCLLNQQTKYIINENAFSKMKQGVMLINTGRGALCETTALIASLESGKVGYAGLDVYEKEHGLFFINHQEKSLSDHQFLKLQSFSNVIITPHQAFFTKEAVYQIIKTTLESVTAFEQGNLINSV